MNNFDDAPGVGVLRLRRPFGGLLRSGRQSKDSFSSTQQSGLKVGEKKESRGDVETHSPQPVARVRPLPTCTHGDPCGQLWAIVRLGSGLTANRENRPTPRDSILLSASSRSPQPALRF